MIFTTTEIRFWWCCWWCL